MPARQSDTATKDTANRIERRRGRRTTARAMFYSHLWLGIVATGILLLIAVTGILLNHKRGLGLMPDVANEARAGLESALPIAALAASAAAALPADISGAAVDRMDVRPDDGIIKVRFDDDRVTEVTVDIHTGEALHVGERNDVFLEKLHSGEIFGDGWVLLSDFAAVMLVVLLISGYWLWLYPRSRA
jgi:uncharacterized iron-regulated membrane protein